MLRLTRKTGQIVGVGEMAITILAVRDNRVELGFEGPRGMSVTRPEMKRKEPHVENSPVSSVCDSSATVDRADGVYPLGNQPAVCEDCGYAHDIHGQPDPDDVATAHRDAYQFDPLPSHLDEAIRYLERAIADADGMEGEPDYLAGFLAYRLGGVTEGVRQALAELRNARRMKT